MRELTKASRSSLLSKNLAVFIEKQNTHTLLKSVCFGAYYLLFLGFRPYFGSFAQLSINILSSNIIALWSGPRNVSTALMYSFANRGDVKVLDEPFFGYFLETTGVWRPSRNEALQTMNTDFSEIMDGVLDLAGHDTIFLKNMANHLVGQSLEHLRAFKNVILTRAPEAVLASYQKNIEKPTMLDLCYEYQLEILEFLTTRNLPFLVLDSDELRKSPKEQLEELCRYLEIPFSENMLSWKAGAREEDGVWAKYWYSNVHKSTGFMPFETKTYQIESEFWPLQEECQARYNQIKAFVYE